MMRAEPDTAQRSPAPEGRADPVRAGLDRLVMRAGRIIERRFGRAGIYLGETGLDFRFG